MRNNRLFKLIAISACYFGAGAALAEKASTSQTTIPIPPTFTVSELTPLVKAGQPVLFVDMACMLCNSLVHEVQGKYDDLRLVFVRAIPPVEKTTNQMLWHLSDSARFGNLDGGCELNCSTVGAIGSEPSEMDFVSDAINYRKRLISIGINSAMHRLAFEDGDVPKVPALYINNKVHVIHNEEELAQKLGDI